MPFPNNRQHSPPRLDVPLPSSAHRRVSIQEDGMLSDILGVMTRGSGTARESQDEYLNEQGRRMSGGWEGRRPSVEYYQSRQNVNGGRRPSLDYCVPAQHVKHVNSGRRPSLDYSTPAQHVNNGRRPSLEYHHQPGPVINHRPPSLQFHPEPLFLNPRKSSSKLDLLTPPPLHIKLQSRKKSSYDLPSKKNRPPLPFGPHPQIVISRSEDEEEDSEDDIPLGLLKQSGHPPNRHQKHPSKSSFDNFSSHMEYPRGRDSLTTTTPPTGCKKQRPVPISLSTHQPLLQFTPLEYGTSKTLRELAQTKHKRKPETGSASSSPSRSSGSGKSSKEGKAAKRMSHQGQDGYYQQGYGPHGWV